MLGVRNHIIYRIETNSFVENFDRDNYCRFSEIYSGLSTIKPFIKDFLLNFRNVFQ
jgi:hypothetical protein